MPACRARALSCCVLFLLTLGPASAQVLDWDWQTSGSGCATVGGADIVLETFAGGCLGLAVAEVVVPESGTITLDVDWSLERGNASTRFDVLRAGEPIFRLESFCPGVLGPCSESFAAFSFHVDAGAPLVLELDAFGQSLPSRTTVTLSNIDFVSDQGFVDVGGSLDSSRLALVQDVAPDDARDMSLDTLPDAGLDGGGQILVGLPRSGVGGRVELRPGNGAAPRVVFKGPAGAELGCDVAGAGDLDGDGYADFIAGAPAYANGMDTLGAVFTISGAKGAVLDKEFGPEPGTRFGQAVDAGGDVDGDGVCDYVVGAPEDGNAGPLAGRAWVLSGVDGSVIHQLDGFLAGERFGFSVAMVGDGNGDGFVDVAVGAPTADLTVSDEGRLRVFSGATGDLQAEFIGQLPGDSLGHAVTGIGDFGFDGFPDIVAGAPGTGLGGDGFGFARGYEGETGNPMFTLFGSGAQFHVGEDVASAGDINNDGFADVLIGAPAHLGSQGRLLVMGGPFGTLLLDELSNGAGEQGGLGGAVAAGVDLDGDEVPDLVAGAPFFGSGLERAGVADSGAIVVLSGQLDDYLAPTLQGSGDLLGGSAVTLTLEGALPDSAAWLIVGLSQVDLPFLGGTLVPSADLGLGPLGVSATGTASFSARWPQGVPAGPHCWVQAWVVDADGPLGFKASNGLRLEAP